MQNEYLRHPLDPWKLCSAESVISIDLPMQNMRRLQEMLVSAEGEAHYELQFSLGEHRLLQVQGKVRGEVTLECQRCLEAVSQTLENEFMWGLVTSEEAAVNLPRTHEPVFIENEKLDLLPALEDELILALPLVAYHPEGGCQLPGQFNEQQPEVQVTTKKENPFSALADLKKSLKSGQ
ncbi:YceD family protein [Marinospirillum insulare]|uniref:Large ribosomal RNA subunit accumulation protein YceD n=1 Tax=Marinospirillum insulare TaxID=217169 RepID=A0ABQ5ZZ86_9GAMM|nr:YceD family protein [Marinospirillum insulare]GLR65269.1 hypothetical protein GCM10007878_27080 [Marinospirillum insulare]